ncbi:Ku protein [Actinoallomurus sp. NBC_01490]|uniref:non-homologous end joining protein Ku n=1 Tax=Actinoallomurus sp. NBC_01490 TaxID=2903557 RepID=UPI002E35E00E|nr:Ku protein [Actinoallomurus sp. NBC_01490]
MRTSWNGAISFGLVTIPVKLYSATEPKDVAFHQVHRKDGGRVRFKRVCTKCGQEVPYSDIASGYELPSGEIVVLTDEDLANLPLPTSRRIDVLLFASMEQVDPIFFDKPYYLEPEAQGTKPYVLLRNALENSGKVAIAKVALRQRESLAILRVREGVVVLETMLWPDEVREPDFMFLEEDVDVRPQELQMASSLIETMAGDFKPDQYEDAYRKALQQLIEAKIEGKQIVPPKPEEQVPAAADLLSALRASVEAAKKGRPRDEARRDGEAGEREEIREVEQGQGAKAKAKGGTRKSA